MMAGEDGGRNALRAIRRLISLTLGDSSDRAAVAACEASAIEGGV